MIVLQNVAKAFPRENGERVNVFNDVNLTIQSTEHVAVMGPKLCGKTTFIKMITGFEAPDAGEIRRHCDISYPVGTMSVLENSLTGRENIQHLSHVFEADPDWTMKFVIQHSELADVIDLPTRSLDHEQKCRLSFTLSYALPFQIYAIDAFIGRGSDGFREKCAAMLKIRAKNSGLIIATANPDLAIRHCEKVIVIQDGNLVIHDDVQEGVQHFKDAKAVSASG